MIHDSSYWKNSLCKHAEMLNEKLEQRVWRDSSFSKVEESVMLSCYIIRKLAEARGIADAKFQKSLQIRSFRANGETVALLNNHKIDSLYQLGNGTDITKPLSYVANQIIHSFMFATVFESVGKIKGIAFNSDRSKSKVLYMLELRPLVEAFASCGECYFSKETYFTLSNGELEVIVEHSL